jgi:hypothetical protein
MIFSRRSSAIVGVLTLLAAPAAALDLGGELPRPKHLAKVLDTGTFLGEGASRYVQIAAYRTHAYALRHVEEITEAGLKGVLARAGEWNLVLMPETSLNTAETLKAWARRSGHHDAFIIQIR